MLGEKYFEIGITASLAIILGVLAAAIIASLAFPPHAHEHKKG
jgi:hypothetical protein